MQFTKVVYSKPLGVGFKLRIVLPPTSNTINDGEVSRAAPQKSS